MDTEEIRKNRYWVAKSHSTRKYPVLFGGDSRIFRGISPDHFESGMFGYETHNYAYWSNGMGRIYLEGMEQKLDMDSELKMIVLGVSPHSLTPNAAKSDILNMRPGGRKSRYSRISISPGCRSICKL